MPALRASAAASSQPLTPWMNWASGMTRSMAFAAMAAAGRYQTVQRYYRPAPDLIAGFAIRTAVSV